ncbi:helix-turn-helix transcriptional regulator [Metabacillus iocasae]|uniref:AraC-like DNA-binding protein n=1 Tax=Priestia iocasae TaxID=2291674 RepID=A0ABS2QXQ7_9BACI|nr:helix-turn-helix domain-containing protein [Metabacillus iocasae]MBM7704265.1 AraC-like DNA-binding protein [Metabacillus iocasae]
MYGVNVKVEHQGEYNQLVDWMLTEYRELCVLRERESGKQVHIIIVEVCKLFDWVKVYRLRKKYKECKIITLLDSSLLATAPLAVECKLDYLGVKPIKKSLFLRHVKRAIGELADQQTALLNYDEIYEQFRPNQDSNHHTLPFQEAFLRRLLRGDVTIEEELIQARSFLPGEAVPNLVCFVQGFVRFPERKEVEGWQAPVVIQDLFRKRFNDYRIHVSFLSYRKHILLLLQVPDGCISLKHWNEGEQAILGVVDELAEVYGIYLYIGIGSVYREPLSLHHSYREARKARRTPPYKRVNFRYYEEIPKDTQIQTCIDYISEHCTEDLAIKQVADHISLSVPYFSRLFKREIGLNFVEYVTFVRLQRAVWLLRHTDYTIERIAEELGFNTPNYFSGTFKKYVGLSPREYRATEEILFV